MKLAQSDMPEGAAKLSHITEPNCFSKMRSKFSKRPRHDLGSSTRLKDSLAAVEGMPTTLTQALSLPDFRTGEVEFISEFGDDMSPPPLRQPFRYAHDRMLEDMSAAAGLLLTSTTENSLGPECPHNVLQAAHVLASLADPNECIPTPLHRHKGPDDEPAEGLENQVAQSYLLPPQLPEHSGRHTLVLDLDETLVHSTQSADASNDWSLAHGDFYCEVEDNGVMEPIYVRVRPWALKFLETMSSLYEVVLFTAGTSKYAEKVAENLDPNRILFHHILTREHCTYVMIGEDGKVTEVPQQASMDGTFYNINPGATGDYVKDLSKLGRDLDKVIIIDNNPKCYLYHPRNALGCSTWRNDRADTELRDFGDFLEAVNLAPEVITDLDAFHRELDSLNKMGA